MRKFLVALALMFIVLLPTTASAATLVEWQADDPKQGRAGFSLCIGEATAGGVTYRNKNWIDNEALANCERYATADVQNFFRFNYVSITPVLTESIEIPASAVKVTVQK